MRFGYGLPITLLYAATLHLAFELELPAPHWAFATYALVGGIAQILGTAFLLTSFKSRNFAVGTAFSKTEAIQAAVFGIVLLGDRMTAAAAAGIAVSFVGVLALAAAGRRDGAPLTAQALFGPAAIAGLVSGAFFGVSAVCYRAGSLSLDGPGFVMQAAYTLAWASVLQTAILTVYLRLREPGQISAVLTAWRTASWVGLSGAGASICWFTALTLQSAGYVRALGQIELVFTFVASALVFRERTRPHELLGIALVIAGILVLLLAG